MEKVDVDLALSSLLQYAIDCDFIAPRDYYWATNLLLERMRLDAYNATTPKKLPLEVILQSLTDDAVCRGVCSDDSISRERFEAGIMGALTPKPSELQAKFSAILSNKEKSIEEATAWYYNFSKKANYIHGDDKKNIRWKTPSPYGDLEISINLSKPEKDPKAIAQAKNAPQVGYPKCQLCIENTGYAGRCDYPARQNLRPIPLWLDKLWYLQYSPYVYYPEHCIAFNSIHTPMVIDRMTFYKLTACVKVLPHYFFGSNADLPIVGGSILSHEHFQGGCYQFPINDASIEIPLSFPGCPKVKGGILHWPMSTIRLISQDHCILNELAFQIYEVWRDYTDEEAMIYAATDGVRHNTVTPIVRRHGEEYELDLILRNNLTTKEHPFGLYHPHEELHHIKKENIGLIEAMGLAILPGRLKNELSALKRAILADMPIPERLQKHAPWVEQMKQTYQFTPENIDEIFEKEIGVIFTKVLEQSGVFFGKQQAFLRFIDAVKKKGTVCRVKLWS